MTERAKIKYIIYSIDMIIDNYHRNVDLHEMKSEYKKIRKEYNSLSNHKDLPSLKSIIKININYLFIPVFIFSIYLVYFVFKFKEEIYLHLVPIFILIISIPFLKIITNVIQKLNDVTVLKRLRLIKTLLKKNHE